MPVTTTPDECLSLNGTKSKYGCKSLNSSILQGMCLKIFESNKPINAWTVKIGEGSGPRGPLHGAV
jgi:hypothetical protein